MSASVRLRISADSRAVVEGGQVTPIYFWHSHFCPGGMKLMPEFLLGFKQIRHSNFPSKDHFFYFRKFFGGRVDGGVGGRLWIRIQYAPKSLLSGAGGYEFHPLLRKITL